MWSICLTNSLGTFQQTTDTQNNKESSGLEENIGELQCVCIHLANTILGPFRLCHMSLTHFAKSKMFCSKVFFLLLDEKIML